MKNKDVVKFVNCKSNLEKKKLPMKLSFALKLNFEKMETYVKAYTKQYDELLENIKLAEKDEEKQEYLSQIEELLETTVTDDVQKVGFDVIEKCDQEKFDTLTVSELEAISFMIE